MSKHLNHVAGYNGSLPDLATEVSNLKYDALTLFLKSLSNKLSEDAVKDRARGRAQLAMCLEKCSESLDEGSISIDNAWKICEPFMRITVVD